MRKLLAVVLVAALSGTVFAGPVGTPVGPFVPASDMPGWESQVVGSVFGMYCGYFPDRVTIVGRSVGLQSYGECRAKFDIMVPGCIGEAKATHHPWQVASPQEGSALGSKIGGCFDRGFAPR